MKHKKVRIGLLGVIFLLMLSNVVAADPEMVDAAKKWPVTGSFETPTGSIYYRVAGEGPPLLMLHGFMGVGTQWEKYLDEFAPHFTLIAPDLPGHGASQTSAATFSLQDTAQGMLLLMDFLGYEKFRGLGYSAGGMTLIHMAAVNPGRVEQLILAASADRALGDREAVPFEQLPAGFQQDMLRNHPSGLPQINRLLAFQATYGSSNPPLDDSVLTKITGRTLLLSGDRDDLFPPATVLRLYGLLPNASLWIEPGIGHTLFWSEWGGKQSLDHEFPEKAVQFLSGN